MTPLHFAASGRGELDARIKCARILVSAGADLTVPDDEGNLPFQAVMAGQDADQALLDTLRHVLTPRDTGSSCNPFTCR